jgi:hypothetical protein
VSIGRDRSLGSQKTRRVGEILFSKGQKERKERKEKKRLLTLLIAC